MTKHTFIVDLDIPVYIRNTYLKNLQPDYSSTQPAKVIALTSYVGHQPTFTVACADGSVFSYIPVEAILENPSGTPGTCNHICPSEVFNTYELAHLKKSSIVVYGKNKRYVGMGEYLFTMEWTEGNEVLHLMRVKGGFSWVPNHKMLVFSEAPKIIPELPGWQKIRTEWR
jgi:hypothetical protein